MAYSLKELAELTNSTVFGDPACLISGVNTLDKAIIGEISFLANIRYIDAMKETKASAICLGKEISLPPHKNGLIAEDPSRAFQTIVELFIPFMKTGFTGIHETAVVHPTAKIAPSAHLSPYSVIDKEAIIDEGTFIGPFVYIGAFAKIGKDCMLHAGSIVRENCILKDRVILQPHAIIGSCGFGYTFENGSYKKLSQVGNVILEEDVEIGAGTTIDRARFQSTIVRKGSKIDNLVQIAHNVEIGPHNAIAAQTGIAGSTKTGSFVMMGGQVGIVGHVEIGDNVQLATRTGVSKSLSTGKYNGSPALPLAEYNRIKVHQKKLESYAKKIQELEKRLEELEKTTRN